MATALAEGHIEAQRRLRVLITAALKSAWLSLPGYDERNLDEWLSKSVPLALTGQRTSVNLTEAYLANFLGRQPLGIDPDNLIGAGVRSGTAPEEVYRRPFVTLWTALGEGALFADASSAALARALDTAALDMQLSMRATAGAVQDADPGVYGYKRVADGNACPFCLKVDGAYVKSMDAYGLHNNCGCGLEPLTSPHPRATSLLSGVAVHEHGELGAVLADPAHDFTKLS